MRGDWEVGAVACCSLRLNARNGKGCTQQLAGRNAVTVNVNISPAISQALPLSHFKCALLCTPSSTRTSTSGTNQSQGSLCLRILDPSTIPSPCWRPSSSPFARPRHLYLPLHGTGPTAACQQQSRMVNRIESDQPIRHFIIHPLDPHTVLKVRTLIWPLGLMAFFLVRRIQCG